MISDVAIFEEKYSWQLRNAIGEYLSRHSHELTIHSISYSSNNDGYSALIHYTPKEEPENPYKNCR